MSINYNASDFLTRVTNNNNYYYTSSYKKNVVESDDDVESFQTKFSDFRKIVRRLSNYNSNDTTEDKLKDYLSDLADTYNSMSKKKENITDSNLKKYLDKLDTLIDDNAKSLKKLGLKKNDDGELEFDEDTFDDDYDQKVADKLFTGTDSFIDQARKLTRKIDYSASDAEFTTTEKRFYDGISYNNEEITQAKAYLNLLNCSTVLNKLNSYIQDDKIGSADKTDVFSMFEGLSKNLNLTDKNGESETIYKTICNENDFNNLGFSFDDDEKKIAYVRNEDLDVTTDDFKKSFNTLFGDSSSLRDYLNEYCQKGYKQTIKFDEINSKLKSDSNSFSIDEYV
jgi:hypothetical protein